MKIALVTPYDYAYSGGVNVHVSYLAHHFDKMGHQAKIYAPCSKRRPQYIEQGIVPLGHVMPIPHNGSIAQVTLSLWLAPKVNSILANEEFDVVHVHEPSCPLLPWLFLYMSDSVNIGSFHYYAERSIRYWLGGRTILKSVCKRLHGRTAVSEPARDCVSRYLPDDYRLIPNGIDLSRFSSDCPPIEEFCDGKTNILFVGRLEKRKGAGYLLNAFERVKREYPNSRLIIAGSGSKQREAYKEEVREKGIRDVVFTGYIPDADLPRYYRTADIFCAPAIGKESFGIVLLEAMAAGKPIVASKIGGYSKLIGHGSNGLLVPPKDRDALADAILSLSKDASLREHLGTQGKQDAAKFSWESVAQRTMAFYLELLAQKGKGGST